MNRRTGARISRQRGVTMTGIIMGGVIVGVLALLAMKLFPDVTEYLAVVKDVKATAQDPATADMSISDIRVAYSKRAEIDNIKNIAPADLDITKEDGKVTIAFAYSRKIPLFANVSLWLDFEGNSAGK